MKMSARRLLPRFAIAGLVLAALSGPLVPAAAAAAPTLSARTVQSGLVHPWDVAFAPNGRMYVTERPGRIRVFASGAVGAARLKTFTVPSVRAEGESGLMGIALHPSFASNGFLYVCASRMDEGQWRNQVLRYRVSGTTFTFSRYIIRRGMRAAAIHDGCRIRFGPDGKLYVTMGDAAVSSRAQNPTALNGKVLRVNADGTIPSDNPIMPGATRRTAVYSMGHRNPQGIAFHPVTNRRYISEHGPDVNDEINLIVARGNYGWPNVTGSDGVGGFRDPCWASGSSTIAISGAAFTRTANWGSFRNQLFAVTLKEQDLRRYSISSDGRTAVQRAIYFDDRWGRLRGITSGPGGFLFLTTSNGSNDRIIRVRPSLP
jgi:glucose/arabinose dehydrogenase